MNKHFMQHILLSCLILCVMSGTVLGQSAANLTSSYLNQEPPGMTPQVFAPELVSLQDQHEFGSVFSADGKTFFYGVDTGGKAEIRYIQFKNGKWTKPEQLIDDDQYSYNDPFLSPDEQRLYFISDMPLGGSGDKKDYDIWYVERKGNQWSAPVNAGKNINTEYNEYYISFTNDGSIYFSSNKGATQENRMDYDIYVSASKNEVFQKATPLSDSINTDAYEADVFIAPDASYLIFCGDREEGFGRGDLYVSFKSTDGTWTKAKNMGDAINTQEYELCPFVSADGKYFFYTSNKDIYWVDARVIHTLR